MPDLPPGSGGRDQGPADRGAGRRSNPTNEGSGTALPAPAPGRAPAAPEAGAAPPRRSGPSSYARSIRSALSSGSGGNSLFSRASSQQTANTSNSTGSSFSFFGKRRTADAERLRVMDPAALATSHEDAGPQAEVPPPSGAPTQFSGPSLTVQTPPVGTINPFRPAPASQAASTARGPRALSVQQTSPPQPQQRPLVVPMPQPETIHEELETEDAQGAEPVALAMDDQPETLIDEEEVLETFTSDTPAVTVTSPTAALEVLAQLRASMLPLVANTTPQNVSRRAGIMAQMLKDYTEMPALTATPEVSTATSEDLVKVIQLALCFSDTLLTRACFRSAKMNLLRSLYRFGYKLNLVEEATGTVPSPRNFALGSEDVLFTETADLLIEGISRSWSLSLEDEGAYIAPVLRGLSPKMAVATFCFGFPHMTDHQTQSILELASVCPDIHMYGRMDYIRPAVGRVIPPFRIPEDPTQPPISISVAVRGAQHTSGTLGGYLYPIIDEANYDLEEYKNSTFAVTCGHVCLADKVPEKNPDIMFPSPVLMKLFRKVLVGEKAKQRQQSMEWQAYDWALTDLDENKPDSLGQLTWGERVVVDGMLSDLALIKVASGLKCRNSLGEDVNMSQYDPGLMMSSLLVNHIVSKPEPGIQVFKYGSTTRYTRGLTSASKIVYWSNKKLQTSEFVVKADSPVFASGGDSGAWILNRGTNGLGVLGMIHSYDGEFKEFGLYTPIERILSRLLKVTGVQWGVVGVPNIADPLNPDSDNI